MKIKSLLALALFFSLMLSPAHAAEDGMLAIVGGRLIDGLGNPPIDDSVILVAGNKIVAVGREGELAVPAGAQIVDSNGMTVMPGLIDLHVHFDIVGHANYDYWFPAYENRMRDEIFPAAAKIMLHSGVTSVRDLGSDVDNIFWLREQLRSGEMEGPRPFIAGPFLRKTKTSFVSDGYVDTWVVESPEDGRKKVRKLVEMGVDLIKTQDEALSKAELAAIYDEAHKHDMPVATHLYSLEALTTALEAGIGDLDTIEHIGDGPAMRYPERVVEMIVDQGVVMEPTIVALDGIRRIHENPELVDDPDWRRGLPDGIYEDIRQSYAALEGHPLFERATADRPGRMAKLRQLHEAGARFVLASDSGTRGNPHHMAAWREMVYLGEVGLTPMEVIVAATGFAAEVLRRDDLGAIEEGRLADIIVVEGDPLNDLSDMKNVVRVIQDGNIVR